MNLFNKNLTRLKLISSKQAMDKNLNIFIHRNHSFEMIESILNVFLNFSDIEAEIKYSSYDDSLTFEDNIDADLHILWLDLNRYNPEFVKQFLIDKIHELRCISNSPVLLAYLYDKEIDFKIDNTYIVHVNSVIEFLKESAYDLEKEAISGTKISSKASLYVAQYLGLKIIPSIIKPALKAIVLDLDNTLYKGIIGEDGIEHIVPYITLLNKLNELKKQGFLLCIASKNNEQDAKKLFEQRKDMILSWQDFTCTKVNWNLKSDNIVGIAKELNIGLDSIIFIDDNIAEIESVKLALPKVKTILAQSEEDVIRHIELYPGLTKTNLTKEDSFRSQDLKANQQRTELSKQLSKEEYFKKLEIEIVISLNDKENITRITELLNKTNQFILSYRRYNHNEVSNILNSETACIVTARMSDKLSDSGIIAILIAKKENDSLLVDELTFSCRALGRNIEDIVISKMILMAKNYLKTNDKLKICYEKGARNVPALSWLENYTKKQLEEKGIIEISINKDIETFGLTIKEMFNV